MLTRIQNWWNSQGIRFFRTLLQKARVDEGDEVNVLVRKEQIVVKPLYKVRGQYDLKELVSRMPKRYQVEEMDWGSPVGKETW